MNLPHKLDRTVVIRASRETVFRFFTDTQRWASWWGKGSTIDAKPGGKMFIQHPEGTQAMGEVLEVTPPEHIVFTYGFVSGKPIAPGTSRVTIRLEAAGPGGRETRLSLKHEFAETAVRDEHVQGWRFQLALFGNLVANEVNANASGVVDAWFDAWAEPDATARVRAIEQIAAPDIHFRDQYSLTDGVADLLPHIAAAQIHMPGIRLRRNGDVRHCQGTVLADWKVVMPDGQQKGTGTNVFTIGPDGRIESVTGFWNRG